MIKFLDFFDLKFYSYDENIGAIYHFYDANKIYYFKYVENILGENSNIFKANSISYAYQKNAGVFGIGEFLFFKFANDEFEALPMLFGGMDKFIIFGGNINIKSPFIKSEYLFIKDNIFFCRSMENIEDDFKLVKTASSKKEAIKYEKRISIIL